MKIISNFEELNKVCIDSIDIIGINNRNLKTFDVNIETSLNLVEKIPSSFTKISESGGQGIIYWEPAWVSTNCQTLWGQGSHWDNATLFDHNNKSTLGMQFYNSSKN